MNVQKSVIFVKKNLKINMVMITIMVKLETIVIVHVNKKFLHIAYVI